MPQKASVYKEIPVGSVCPNSVSLDHYPESERNRKQAPVAHRADSTRHSTYPRAHPVNRYYSEMTWSQTDLSDRHRRPVLAHIHALTMFGNTAPYTLRQRMSESPTIASRVDVVDWCWCLPSYLHAISRSSSRLKHPLRKDAGLKHCYRKVQ